MTVSVDGSSPQTITFGTGAGMSRRWRSCKPRPGACRGVTGTVNTANGDITLTASRSDRIDRRDQHRRRLPSKFGIHQDIGAYPANGTVIGNDVIDLHQPIDRWRLDHLLRLRR